MKKLVCLAIASAGVLLVLSAQIREEIDKSGGTRPTIAIPDLRGSGEAQALMGAFNDTLRPDVSSSGMVKVAPKTSYPLTIPQQPSDFTQPPAPSDIPRARKGDPPPLFRGRRGHLAALVLVGGAR